MERLRASAKTLLLIGVAILVAAGTVAVASIPGSDGVITACYNTSAGATYGALRVIDPSLSGTTRSSNEYSCQTGETQITWNQQGPVGPTGPAGPSGPSGPQGPQGQRAPSSGFGFSAGGSAIFLAMPNIQGDAIGPAHKNEIKLLSVSLGGAGGSSAKKVKVGEIVITKHVDKSSPKLFEATATGKNFQKATISFAKKSNGKLVDYLKFKLTGVIVSSDKTANSSDPKPTEHVTLQFTKVSVEYIAGRHHTSINLTPSHISLP